MTTAVEELVVLTDDFRPTKYHLSNSEIRATGILMGGAVQNVCRELLSLRERIYYPAISAVEAEERGGQRWLN